MPESKATASTPGLPALLDLTTTSQALLTTYQRLLTSPQSAPAIATPSESHPPHPLQLLRDASLLLKSHTTKLSLLLLNKPFTPTAVTKVLREITGTCLPAIMAAVELARADIWGRLLRGEIVKRVGRVLREVGEFLSEVKRVAEQDGEVEVIKKGEGARRGSGRSTLASTGVLWEACDEVVSLEELDVGGVALKKAKEYQSLIKDAIDELREWGEEGEEDEDDAYGEGDDEDIFGPQSIPHDRPELKDLLGEGLGKLRKIEILYTAVIKRRIKTFTKEKARSKVHVTTMDRLMDHLKRLPELTDELASGFYDLDEDAVRQQTQAVLDGAMGAISLVEMSWDGGEDEFTAWSGKWIEVVK